MLTLKKLHWLATVLLSYLYVELEVLDPVFARDISMSIFHQHEKFHQSAAQHLAFKFWCFSLQIFGHYFHINFEIKNQDKLLAESNFHCTDKFYQRAARQPADHFSPPEWGELKVLQVMVTLSGFTDILIAPKKCSYFMVHSQMKIYINDKTVHAALKAAKWQKSSFHDLSM